MRMISLFEVRRWNQRNDLISVLCLPLLGIDHHSARETRLFEKRSAARQRLESGITWEAKVYAKVLCLQIYQQEAEKLSTSASILFLYVVCRCTRPAIARKEIILPLCDHHFCLSFRNLVNERSE